MHISETFDFFTKDNSARSDISNRSESALLIMAAFVNIKCLLKCTQGVRNVVSQFK